MSQYEYFDQEAKTFFVSCDNLYPWIIIWTIKLISRYKSHSLHTIYGDRNIHKPDYYRFIS